jgi:YHS domain-containing protein
MKVSTFKALAAAIFVGAAPLAVPAAALAAAPQIYTAPFSRLAVGGYDTVAYFDGGKPVRGDAAFSMVWQGAEFRFVSTAHLAKFRANPAAYAPQFGGYCAWAIADGHLASGDPQVWRIVSGRLYLNYNRNVQKRWEGDVPGNIAKANSHWPKILG